VAQDRSAGWLVPQRLPHDDLRDRGLDIPDRDPSELWVLLMQQ
jgi:hypothetical protein